MWAGVSLETLPIAAPIFGCGFGKFVGDWRGLRMGRMDGNKGNWDG